MGSLNIWSKSLHCTLLHSNAPKSAFRNWLENVLGKTREFVRCLTRKGNEIAADNVRFQHRLPVEYFSSPTVPLKTKFFSYRPGFINDLTSKWVRESLAGTARKRATRKTFSGAGVSMLGLVGFGLAKKPSLLTDEEELESVSYEIREAFSTIPSQCYPDQISIINLLNEKQVKFSDLKIGELIGKGCNAAVYSASLVDQNNSETLNVTTENFDFKEEADEFIQPKIITSNSVKEANFKLFDVTPESFDLKQESDESIQPKIIISHSEREANFAKEISKDPELVSPSIKSDNTNEFNLAVKIMFNYCAESNAFAIWRAMYKETLPAITDFSLGEMGWHKVRKKKLKPHPNIVEMYFAFADQLPLLPGAFTNFPQALPTRLLSDGCGRNMTLFLVMKKYDCSLKEYLKMYDISAHTALLLFTQLLEALVHLLQNGVAHRDLKTDNILLDFSYGTASPRLAITDFGCSSETLQLNYQSPDIEKGGNIALMAPEVVNAEAGHFSVIDYSRADLWTAGTLAYEIFGSSNPFYSPKCSLKNSKYDAKSLPLLPSKAPTVVQKLVKDILQINPNQRPSQSFAATVCQVLLHGSPDISQCNSSKHVRHNALKWMFLMAAETYLEASLPNSKVKTLELELRHTFCSRIQYLEVQEAVKYIAQV